MAFRAQTCWDHEGWQLASETGHYFSWEQKPHSQKHHTLLLPKKKIQILYKWHSYVLKEWRGGLQKYSYWAY